MNQTQQPEALQLAEMLEALGWREVDKDLRKAGAELRRLHARVQELESERATDDRVLRASVPDRWKGCTSPVGSAQSYIAELEGQQKREPLSDQQILDAWYGCGIGTTYDIAPSQDDIDWARAIERAHGITAQPEYYADNERDHSDEDAAIAAGKVQAALQGRVG